MMATLVIDATQRYAPSNADLGKRLHWELLASAHRSDKSVLIYVSRTGYVGFGYELITMQSSFVSAAEVT